MWGGRNFALEFKTQGEIMIQFKKLFVVIVVGMVGFGSSLAEWRAGAAQGAASADAANVVRGELVVRFKSPSSMGLQSGRFHSNSSGLSGVPADLRALHQKAGLRRIRRLSRPEEGGRRLSRSLQSRMAARAERAPRRVREMGAQFKDSLDRTAVLSFDSSRSLTEVLREYRANPEVESVEPHYQATAYVVPTDPSYSSLWGLPKIQAPQAWDLQTGSGVVVAVIDSGVDYTHPDLAANMWVNTDEVAGNGIDDDANGFVDDVRGWDFAYDDANPMDDHYHGTHVAGTVAAVANNGVGVAGVAFNAKIMAVKGLDSMGYGGYADLAAAVIYATDNGADVINASWGGSFSDATLSNAVAYAQSHGVVFVAAAGNSDLNAAGFYPVSYPGVIAVAASDSGDNRATFSNWGSRIDVAAPGVSIYSTFPGASYNYLSGTSMASPHVAGVAALVLSKNPSLSVVQVRDVLRAAVDDIGAPGFDIYTGNGRINALKAVQAVTPPVDNTPPSVVILSPANGAIVGGSLSVTGTASDNAGVQQIAIFVDGGFVSSIVGSPSWSYVLETTGYSNGGHTLSVRVTDISGFQTTASISLTINNVNDGNALYNATYRAPSCLVPGAFCDTGALAVLGRGIIMGGFEPNAPNTLQSGCAEGSLGRFHSDESNDRLRVVSVDGSPLAVGKLARVEATVWAYAGGYAYDYLDIFLATEAAKPVWMPVATLQPTKGGAQTISTTFTLSTGAVQAVRANFRYMGSPAPCTAGSYDDRDDLVFAVAGSPSDLTPPTVAVATPLSGSLVRGFVPLTATASDAGGVARVQYALDDVPLGPALTAAPYSFPWDSLPSLEGPHTLSARAWDASGNSAKSGNVLVFVDNAETVISSVTVSSVTSTSAAVSWKTNVVTQLHEIEYGPTALYGSTVAFSSALSKDPSRILSGLLPGTTFHFRVKSKTSSAEPWGVSSDQVFVTASDATPPVISGIYLPSVGVTVAEVRWTTNEPADTQVEYGLTTAYGQLSPLKATLETSHAVSLSGLSSGLTYHYRVRSRDAAGNLAVSSDLSFFTLDKVPPAVSVTSPADGATLTGPALLTGSATDDNSVTHVTLYIDGRLWKTIAGAGPAALSVSGRDEEPVEATEVVDFGSSLPWSFSLDTTQLDNGPHLLRFESSDGYNNIGFSSRTVTSNNGSLIAVFDPTLKSPACGLPGAVCASGGRLEGRAALSINPEPNQPNTIQSSCADGAMGTYHSDESLDWLKVSSLDGYPLAPGKEARVDAKGWVFSQTSDFLELFVAADAQSPVWVPIKTFTPTGRRSQVFSTTFTVPLGGEFQAIRGLMRYGGGGGACVAGSFNDHDDLVYRISTTGPGAPTTVRLSTGTSQSLVFSWGGATGTVESYRIDVSSNAAFTTFLPGFQARNVGMALTWPIDGLSPLTTYYARVRAVNAGGSSLYSPTAVATTLGLPDLIVKSLSSKYKAGPGELFNVRLGVQNIGSWPTGVPLGWSLLNNGVSAHSGGMLPLGAGEIRYTGDLSVTAPSVEGKYVLEGRVNVGVSPVVPESNTTNNTMLVEYVVDRTPPALVVSSPLASAVVNGVTPITVLASDVVSGVDRVVLSVDGVVVSTLTAAPYQYAWNTKTVSDGPHTLTVEAVDRGGLGTLVTLLVNVNNTNAAQRIALLGAPATTVVARKPLPFWVDMKNTGSTTWSAAAGYKLQAQSPAGNTAWGISEVSLGAATVAPGMTFSFLVNVTAPAAPGAYPLHFRMAKTDFGAFGDDGINQTMTVLADTTPPNTPTGLTATAPSTSTFLLSWKGVYDNAAVASYRVDVSTLSSFAVLWPGNADLNVGNVTSRMITGLSAGLTYYARVRAVDVNGLVSVNSASVAFATLLTPDVTPPGVAFTAPVDGAVVTGNALVSVNASDNVGLRHVNFLLDGASYQTVTSPPYQLTWLNGGVASGSHTWTAQAVDFAGNMSVANRMVVMNYDRTPPSVPGNPKLVFPTVSQLQFEWNASTDNVATTQYQIQVSTNPSFTNWVPGYYNRLVGNVTSFMLTGLSAGVTYYAKVQAYDANANKSAFSATAVGTTLSTADLIKPTVSLSTPTAGAIVGGTVTVTAIATDNVAVTKVLFYVDGSLKVTDLASPYQFAWDTSLVSTGTHTLKAEAYDASGNTGTHSVSLTVRPVGMTTLAVEPPPVPPADAFGLKEVMVFPSPVRGNRATVRVLSGDTDSVRLTINSANGDRVREISVGAAPTLVNGRWVVDTPLDVSDFSSGVYFLTVEAVKGGETQRKTSKFVVLR